MRISFVLSMSSTLVFLSHHFSPPILCRHQEHPLTETKSKHSGKCTNIGVCYDGFPGQRVISLNTPNQSKSWIYARVVLVMKASLILKADLIKFPASCVLVSSWCCLLQASNSLVNNITLEIEVVMALTAGIHYYLEKWFNSS